MVTPLLQSKLYIPPPRPRLVARRQLIDQLEEGLRLGRTLTLVSAPAGFGKTTLITEWILGGAGQVGERAEKRNVARELAWISLDESDNDPLQFLTYLIAALQQVNGAIGQTVQPLIQSLGMGSAAQVAYADAPPIPGLVTPLINDVMAGDSALTLVLDDYHFISSSAVHQTVQFLLDHQPQLLHLVISTREDPPLQLARLRVRGQITELRERDLRFTTPEVETFVRQTLGQAIPAQAVTALQARTEGWVAGLQLAALALQENPWEAEAFIASFAGDDRYIVDYLMTEVIERQNQAVRDFLRQTSVLDQLSAPVCDALTGQENSQALIEQLEATNLFLIPLDHRREWYRYYHLFAEFLRTQLEPQEKKTLHQRAARWYEQHGFKSQAIQHALAYTRICGDIADAERLICQAAEETLHNGHLAALRGWLDSLPDQHVRANPELATYKSWVLVLGGQMTQAESYIQAAETGLQTALGATARSGRLLALQSFIAVLEKQDYPAAVRLANEALQALAPEQNHWRLIALWAKAESQERTEPMAQAIATLQEARRSGLALGNQISTAMIEISLILALNTHGQRNQAMAVCQEAIERYTETAGRPIPMAGFIFSRLGMLYYETNQLELAYQYHQKGLALIEQLSIAYNAVFFQGLMAPVQHARGESQTALIMLQRAHQVSKQVGYMDESWFVAWEMNIHLAQGRLAQALQLAQAAGLSPDDEPDYLRVEMHLAYARLLLAQGRLPEARRWLARLERFTHERGMLRWLISVYILQAIVAQRSAEQPVALDRLTRALKSAAPQGYLRAFLDEDERCLVLLPDVRHVAAAFVDQILEQAGHSELQRQVTAQQLVEPLSERELEVLRLVAAGLANREIAQELVIATGTVKRHINNIYGKLNANSRIQAVARAQELGLL